MLRKLVSIMIMSILILSTFPPIPIFAADEDVGKQTVVKNGKSFYITTVYKEGKTGKYHAKGSNFRILDLSDNSEFSSTTNFTSTNAETLAKLYVDMSAVDSDATYSEKENADALKSIYKSVVGGDFEGTSERDMLLDIIAATLFVKAAVVDTSTLKDSTAFATHLNSIDYNRTVSSALLTKLKKEDAYKSINSFAEVKSDLEPKIVALGSQAVNSHVNEKMYTRYLAEFNDVTEIKLDSYETALKVFVILGWEEFYKMPEYESFMGKLQLDPKEDKVENVKKLWYDYTRYNGVDYSKLQALYSVIMMKTSIFHSQPMDDTGIKPPDTDNWSEVENYKELALESAQITKDRVDKLGTGTQTSLKQRRTFDTRLKYHFYASHVKDRIPEGDESDTISKTVSEDLHFFEIEPVDPDSKLEGEVAHTVTNSREFVNFMNVINEIPYAREIVFKSDLATLSANTVSTNELQDLATYLKTMKAGIVFLETLTMYDFNHVIDYWYSTTNGQSLESIYQAAISLGLMDKLDEGNIEFDQEKPFSAIFDIAKGDINLFLRMGIANSAMYTPLQTNLYEVSTYRHIDNEDFFNQFHYVWGFNRKALYIDTTTNAATNLFNTGKVGSLKPVTLRDLLETGNDVVLYSDTALYNANKLQTAKEKADVVVSDAKAKAESIKQQAQSAADTANDVKDFVQADAWDKTKSIAKYGMGELADNIMNSSFVQGVQTGLTAFAQATQTFLDWVTGSPKENDDLFMSKEQIIESLQEQGYSETKAFAVVSAIYRDEASAKYIQDAGVHPVFIASENLTVLPSTGYRDQSSIMNYALMQNIRDKKLIDYRMSLDLDAPLFIDIYGNIVTTSGYVVIPAASNATLQTKYSPYSAGFVSTYGAEYSISTKVKFPSGYDDSDITDKESRVFEYSEDEKSWQFKELSIDSVVDLHNLSTASEETQKTLYSLARKHLDAGNWDNSLFVANVLIPVMLGAPIEHMDMVAEGIKPDVDVSNSGIVQAYKLDRLKEALDTKSQNVLISVPNPAFMKGLEYVIFFMFKIAIIVGLALIFIQIFVMTMKNQFNLFNIFKLGGTVILIILFMYVVPVIYNVTYYQTNKILLQDEAIHLSMLNLEKRESGVEIGVTKIGRPEISTNLLVKVEDLDLPWLDVIQEIVYSSIDNNLTKVYEGYASTHLVSYSDEIVARGDKLYLDVDKIYDSSVLVFEPTFQNLYQQTTGDVTGAFYLPYYAILDSLIANINNYNDQNQSYTYTTNTHSGGRLKSVGLLQPFFTSDEFMTPENHEDYLNLRVMYDMDVPAPVTSPFTDDDLSLMENTLWLGKELHSDETVEKNIEKLNNEMRKFVVKNVDLMGRISDETFLKTLALHLSLEYNKLFKVGKADSIDIFNLSPDDLVRLSVASKGNVMEGSTFSYSRFIFDQGGELAVYLAAILEVILFIGGWIKPIVTIILFLVLFMSVFVYRLILNENNAPAQGTLLILVYLCGTNLLYALILKASLFLPELGLATSLCLIIQTMLHTIFILAFAYILTVVIRDPHDFGANVLRSDLQRASGLFSKRSKNQSDEEDGLRNGEGAGWDTYRQKVEKDEGIRHELIYDDYEPPSAKKHSNSLEKDRQRDNKEPTNLVDTSEFSESLRRPEDIPEERLIMKDNKTVYEYKYPDGRVEHSDKRINHTQ